MNGSARPVWSTRFIYHLKPCLGLKIKSCYTMLHNPTHPDFSLVCLQICNNERQARHFRSRPLRQVQAEEDWDPGEKPPAYKREYVSCATVATLPPVFGSDSHLSCFSLQPSNRRRQHREAPPIMHCTPLSSHIALFQSLPFSCITL